MNFKENLSLGWKANCGGRNTDNLIDSTRLILNFSRFHVVLYFLNARSHVLSNFIQVCMFFNVDCLKLVPKSTRSGVSEV